MPGRDFSSELFSSGEGTDFSAELFGGSEPVGDMKVVGAPESGPYTPVDEAPAFKMPKLATTYDVESALKKLPEGASEYHRQELTRLADLQEKVAQRSKERKETIGRIVGAPSYSMDMMRMKESAEEEADRNALKLAETNYLKKLASTEDEFAIASGKSATLPMRRRVLMAPKGASDQEAKEASTLSFKYVRSTSGKIFLNGIQVDLDQLAKKNSAEADFLRGGKVVESSKRGAGAAEAVEEATGAAEWLREQRAISAMPFLERMKKSTRELEDINIQNRHAREWEAMKGEGGKVPVWKKLLKEFGAGEVGTVYSTALFLAKATGNEKAAEAIELRKRKDAPITPAEERGIATQIAGGLGSTAPSLLLGGGASQLAKAGKVGRFIGALVSGSQEAMSNAGDVYSEALSMGKTEDEAKKAMWTTFVANVPMNVLLDKVAFFDEDAGKFLARLAKGSAPEAFQEGAQQVIQNLALGKPWNEGVAESALLGGAVGGIIKGAQIVADTRTTQPTQEVQGALPVESTDAMGQLPLGEEGIGQEGGAGVQQGEQGQVAPGEGEAQAEEVDQPQFNRHTALNEDFVQEKAKEFGINVPSWQEGMDAGDYVEARASGFRQDPNKFWDFYKSIPETMGGKVVDGDVIDMLMRGNHPEAYTLLDTVEFKDPMQRMYYNDHVDKLANTLIVKTIMEDAEPGQSVVFTAGVPGTGKSTTGRSLVESYGDGIKAVIDSPMRDPEIAMRRMQIALDHGYKVVVPIVVGNPGDSMGGVMTRTHRELRGVSPLDMANLAIDLTRVLPKKLVERFGDNPNVDVMLVESLRGEGKKQRLIASSLEDGADVLVEKASQYYAGDKKDVAKELKRSYLKTKKETPDAVHPEFYRKYDPEIDSIEADVRGDDQVPEVSGDLQQGGGAGEATEQAPVQGGPEGAIAGGEREGAGAELQAGEAVELQPKPEEAVREVIPGEDNKALRHEVYKDGEFRKAETKEDVEAAVERVKGEQPWTKQLTANQRQALKNVGGIVEQAPVAKRIKEWTKDAFTIQKWIDQFQPLKAIDSKAYILSRLSKASDGAMEALMLYGNLNLRDDVTDASAAGKGVIDTLRELNGEQEQFLWWVAANRAERLSKEDREHLFTDKDIAELKTLNLGQMKDGKSRTSTYAKILSEYNAINKSVLDVAEQSGIINKEDRATWENEFYVPFYRAMQDGVGGPNLGTGGGLVKQYAFKQLKGGKEKLNNDILYNVLMNWSHLIQASAKNRAAKASLEAASEAGVAKAAREGEDGAVWYLDNGRKKFYTVEDPHVMEAITAINRVAIDPKFVKIASAFKRALTRGVTANPTFKIRNLMRDSVAAVAVSGISPNIFKNVATGVKYASNKKSQLYASALASGAVVRFGAMMDGNSSKHLQRLINSGVNENTIVTKWEHVVDTIQKTVDAYDELGDISEGATRIAAFKQALDKGESFAEAAYGARDILDFTMGGTGGAVRFLTQTVPFFNARLQGLYKMGKAAKEQPVKFSSTIGAVALASLVLMLAYKDDEDWKKREDWDRDNFWWFKIGKTAYRVPKPFEVGSIGTIAERSVELYLDDEMTKKRFLDRMKAVVGDTFAMNPVPQMVKPAMEVWANKDPFMGRPIESAGMEKQPKPERFTERTSELAKLGGKADVLSPVQIDYLVKGYFGWLGTQAMNTSDILMKAKGETGPVPERRLEDMFLVGSFAEQLPSNKSRYLSTFYSQAKETDMAYNEYRKKIKVGDKEAAVEIEKKDPKLVARYKTIGVAKRQISSINDKIKAVKADPKMTSEQKRKQIDQLTKEKNKVARSIYGAIVK